MRDWMRLAGIRSSEITDQSVFRRRRQLLQASVAAGMTGLIGTPASVSAAPLTGVRSVKANSARMKNGARSKRLRLTTISMNWVPTRAIRFDMPIVW